MTPTMEDKPKPVMDILRMVAARHKLPVGSLSAKTREGTVVAARREAAHKLRDYGYSLPQIGRFLGGRHHASIIWLLTTPGRPGPTAEQRLRRVAVERERLLAHVAKKLQGLDDREQRLRRELAGEVA